MADPNIKQSPNVPASQPSQAQMAEQEREARERLKATREERKAAYDKVTEARRAIDEEQAKVMATSKPTPTQRDLDLIKLGVIDHDEKEPDTNPEMPPLHEQQRRISEAEGPKAGYQTRAMGPKPKA